MARPTKYDRTKLLDTATSLFWEKGYRGVSIGDLVRETGVLAGSLYSSFGNKDGVFIECVHNYANQSAELYKSAEQADGPLGKVEALFRNMVHDSLQDERRRGCFVVNALLEIAPEKPEIAKVLNYYVRFSEGWIADRLEEAKSEGVLKAEVECKELAASLFGIVYAVRVKARANESAGRVRGYQEKVFAALLDPWRA